MQMYIGSWEEQSPSNLSERLLWSDPGPCVMIKTDAGSQLHPQPWTCYVAQADLELWIFLPGTGSSIVCYHVQLNENLCALPNLTDVVEPFRSQ